MYMNDIIKLVLPLIIIIIVLILLILLILPITMDSNNYHVQASNTRIAKHLSKSKVNAIANNIQRDELIINDNQVIKHSIRFHTKTASKARHYDLKMINHERGQYHLKPLRVDKDLQLIANARAKQMYHLAYHTHTTLTDGTVHGGMNSHNLPYNTALAIDLGDEYYTNGMSVKQLLQRPIFHNNWHSIQFVDGTQSNKSYPWIEENVSTMSLGLIHMNETGTNRFFNAKNIDGYDLAWCVNNGYMNYDNGSEHNGHRSNILNPNAHYYASSVYLDKHGNGVFVEEFV